MKGEIIGGNKTDIIIYEYEYSMSENYSSVPSLSTTTASIHCLQFHIFIT